MDARDRLLIVPAAGRGSRLGGDVPKVLAHVGGRPMLDWLVRLYRPWVGRFVVIVAPDARAAVAARLAQLDVPADLAEQARPTGMLDAILAPFDLVSGTAATRVWITWCDQVAVSAGTVARLAAIADASDAPLVVPTVARADPYVHLDRDAAGRIVRVRHRREGDTLPDPGESEMGLFSLTREGYLDRLPAFAGAVPEGGRTGERNFLPFIPWLAARAPVETFPVEDPIESVGVNTPEERAIVERALAAREGR